MRKVRNFYFRFTLAFFYSDTPASYYYYYYSSSLPPALSLLHLLLDLLLEDVGEVPRLRTHPILAHLGDLLLAEFDLIAGLALLLWFFAGPSGLDGAHELQEGS